MARTEAELLSTRNRSNARVARAEEPGNGSAENDFSWMLLFIVELNRNFHRAGGIQRSDARIYLPDDDNGGVRNLLAIIPIEDGHVTTRRPINHLANFVSVGSFSLFRNRTRQMSEFFSAEQIVHREREWQQRNKVTSCLAVVQRGDDYVIVDF